MAARHASDKMDRKWHRNKDGTSYWASPEVSYYIKKEKVFTRGHGFYPRGRRKVMWALYYKERGHGRWPADKEWRGGTHYRTLKEAKAAGPGWRDRLGW